MFDFDMNVEFLRMAMWQIVIIAGPILGVALAIGLLIGIIQAATSINEMTLSFVPKLVLVLLTFGFAANFILVNLTDYFAFIFDQITQIGKVYLSYPLYLYVYILKIKTYSRANTHISVPQHAYLSTNVSAMYLSINHAI